MRPHNRRRGWISPSNPGPFKDFRRDIQDQGRGDCASDPARPKGIESVRSAARRLHFSIRTEDAYDPWVKRFVLFHGKRHPLLMGEAEIVAFLDHLAVQQGVAASTQNQALAALLFLYNVVLERPLEAPDEGRVRARRPERVPVILSRDKVRALLEQLEGTPRLMGEVLIRSGLQGQRPGVGTNASPAAPKEATELQPRATPWGS
ncbi:MAG: phage integrase N-terminal SAM-like domain-containing protein [Isosphaeraceae bacterium]